MSRCFWPDDPSMLRLWRDVTQCMMFSQDEQLIFALQQFSSALYITGYNAVPVDRFLRALSERRSGLPSSSLASLPLPGPLAPPTPDPAQPPMPS